MRRQVPQFQMLPTVLADQLDYKGAGARSCVGQRRRMAGNAKQPRAAVPSSPCPGPSAGPERGPDARAENGKLRLAPNTAGLADKEHPAIIVELANGGPPTVIHRAAAPAGSRLSLRIDATNNDFALKWSSDGRDWKTFTPPAGIEPVTVQAAGDGIHFTGAVVGLRARHNPTP